jgi:hypothetical protein
MPRSRSGSSSPLELDLGSPMLASGEDVLAPGEGVLARLR